MDVRKRQVGMVFQSYALFPNMTAAQNVAFGLSIQKRPQAEINRRVGEMLLLVGLAGKGGGAPRPAFRWAAAACGAGARADYEPQGAADGTSRFPRWMRRFARACAHRSGKSSRRCA